MSANGGSERHPGPRNEQCPAGRRGRAAMTAMLLVTIGAAAALVATLSVASSAHGGMRGFVHGGVYSAEDLEDRAGYAVAWVLGTVDATDAQEQQIEAIVGEAARDVYPLVARHRERRDAMVTALARPGVDRETLERLRREELAAVDAASERLLDAVVEAAAVLTPAQRQDLLARAGRWRH